MRNVRNITVAVTPELYRQTRKLAAEYDTTVTAIVAYLLERLPDALKRAGYPVGGMPVVTAYATAPAIATPGPVCQESVQCAEAPPPPPPKPENSACTAVRTKLSPSIS